MMIYTVLALAVVCGISEAVVCKTDGDCGSGECCYIQPEFLVASKRQLVLPELHQHHDTGVCEKYHLQGESCYPLETANGHCGCGAGLSCQWVPLPTRKRGQIYHPGPGSEKCVCEKYRPLGDHCGAFETMNGHCGCGAGMSCQWVPVTTTVGPGGKRMIPYHDGPGAYRCAVRT